MKLISLLIASLCVQISIASIDECKLKNGEMHKNDVALSQASDQMWAKFDETCETADRCILKVGEQTASTRLSYMAMRETDQYENVRKACNELGTTDAPTTLCKVNSELEIIGA